MKEDHVGIVDRLRDATALFDDINAALAAAGGDRGGSPATGTGSPRGDDDDVAMLKRDFKGLDFGRVVADLHNGRLLSDDDKATGSQV